MRERARLPAVSSSVYSAWSCIASACVPGANVCTFHAAGDKEDESTGSGLLQEKKMSVDVAARWLASTPQKINQASEKSMTENIAVHAIVNVNIEPGRPCVDVWYVG